MNISFLTSEYPNLNTKPGGGIATSIHNLARALSYKVESVTVFVIGCKDEMEFYDNKIRIVCIKAQSYKIGGWYFHRKYIAKRLNKYIISNKIDILEVPDWTGLSAFMKLKCPIIIKVHGSDTFFCKIENRPQKWKNRWFESLAFQNADGIVGVSKFALDLTNDLFNIRAEIPQAVIYNGIDVSQFQQTNSVSEPIVMYFGTLIRKKGVFELPHIFNKVIKKFPTTQFIIAGQDCSDIFSGRNSTWNMIQPMFSNEVLKQLKYLGKMPYSDMKELISKTAVCIFPSFAEALPVSWLEAMAMEKAIVASNIGWAFEIIEDGVEGYLVNPIEHEKYADAIIELLQNSDKSRKYGQNALIKINKMFESNLIASRNIEFYRQIIKKKNF